MSIIKTTHFKEQKKLRKVKLTWWRLEKYLIDFVELKEGYNKIIFGNNIIVVSKKNDVVVLITCWETNINKERKIKKIEINSNKNKEWNNFLAFKTGKCYNIKGK